MEETSRRTEAEAKCTEEMCRLTEVHTKLTEDFMQLTEAQLFLPKKNLIFNTTSNKQSHPSPPRTTTAAKSIVQFSYAGRIVREERGLM